MSPDEGGTMTMDDLVRMLQARPFKPFQIRLKNGTVYPVRHPDLALPTQDGVQVGVPRSARQADDVAVVPLDQVTALEPLPQAKTK